MDQRGATHGKSGGASTKLTLFTEHNEKCQAGLAKDSSRCATIFSEGSPVAPDGSCHLLPDYFGVKINLPACHISNVLDPAQSACLAVHDVCDGSAASTV